MKINIQTPFQALNKSYLRLKTHRMAIDVFKTQFLLLLDRTNDKETEEFHKNLISEFLKETYYKGKHFINTKGRNDLVIHNKETAKTSVGIILEAKKPTNIAEMPTPQDLNVKAFHELILYYLRERITLKNLEIRHLIITNVYEWFVFDGQVFDRLFAQDKQLVQQFQDFEEGRLADTRTDFFYKQIVEPFIHNLQEEITLTYLDLKTYEKFARNHTLEDDKKLLQLFKFFSPEHLLKLPFVNDSNTLDKGFYFELLHVMGLTEVQASGKKLIQRLPPQERLMGSILEETILRVESLQKLDRLPNLETFGANREEQLFGVALELTITWINRILFLKLLEAQLISYHKDDPSYAFLASESLRCASGLDVLFFEVLAKQPENRHPDTQKQYEKIPYLNSSLFEITELEHHTVLIGNLNTDKALPLHPQTVLKDRKGRKQTEGLRTLDYLFAFLDAYDFGAEGKGEIQEDNKPLITASVLGLVFEKINGYQDGSFFTPGFITMYMCRETIRRAVVQKFNEVKKWNCKTIEDIYDKIEDRKEANDIINNIKICDPAVGSGHFLVSALNELIVIKNELGVLMDKNGKTLRRYKISVANDELQIVDEDEEIYVYSRYVPEIRRIQETLFREKQTIIENCLFGVDINPNSVKICRLRLWIELLKNAYYTEASNYKYLETLPNIDINIKAGNSLVSKLQLNDSQNQFTPAQRQTIRRLIPDYKKQVSLYKSVTDKDAKRKIVALLANYRQTFLKMFNPNDADYQSYKNIENKWVTEQLSLHQTEEVLQKLYEDLEIAKGKWEEKTYIYRNSFEWRFEFPEVLDEEGNFVGFDVVIGNPPYIRQEELKSIKQYLSNRYQVFVAGGDIFYYFYELSHGLLKENTHLAFITNTFDKTNSGKILREFLMQNFNFYHYIDFTEVTVFDEATTYPIVLIAKKSLENDFFKFFKHSKNNFNKKKLIYEDEQFRLIPQKSLNSSAWNFLDIPKQAILSKMQQHSTIFEQFGKCYRGIITGLNEAFITTKNLGKYAEIKKVYEGKDIKKWVSPSTEKYMIVFESKSTQKLFGEIHENEAFEKIKTAYPEIFEHLLFFKDKAIQRLDKGAYWWELRNCTYYDLFAKPKIIFPNLQHTNKFAYDDKGTYINAPAVFLPTDSKALLGILNSKLTWFFLKSICVVRSGGYIEVKPQYFEQIPIAPISEEMNKALIDKVNTIINLKFQNPDAHTSDLETEIDNLVYQLYQLTEEEIKIVDNAAR